MKKGIIILVLIGLLAVPGMVWGQTDLPDAIGSGKTGPDAIGSGKKDPAENKAPSSLPTLQNPLNADSVEEVIYLIVDIMIYIGIIFAILAIIWVGFLYIFAQGKPEEINKVHAWFMYIIIGLAVLISAKAIVEIVKNTLQDAGVVKQGTFK